MNADEYTKMFQLEDRYWWFVGRRNLALGLLKQALGAGGGVRGRDEQACSSGEHERAKASVVDLGCGTGVVMRELDTWADPIGLDMSPLALGYCCDRGLDHLVQGDGARMPLASDSVDAMIGLDIFEHIEDDQAALNEAHRVLKPGGVLVLSVPAFQSLWGPHDVALMHFRRYRRPEMRERLEKAGFRVDRLSYSVFFLFPVVVLWRVFEKRKKGPARASLVSVPEWANKVLIGLQNLEARLIGWFDLPVGSSVVAVAVKPDGAEPRRGSIA